MSLGKIHRLSLMVTASALILAACGEGKKEDEAAVTAPTATEEVTPAVVEAPGPNVLEIDAVGMSFEGPGEIPAGWTTIRMKNTSDMLHFAIVDVLPEGVTAEAFASDVAVPFQEAMDGMIAGDEEATNAAFGKFPAWIAELGRNGGPGFTSAGNSSEATVYLAPGNYAIECYVKTAGIFHTTPMEDRPIGMLLPLTVTQSDAATGEPEANLTVNVTNAGYEIVEGALRVGSNMIRVNFVEQQALPTFVGNDIHLMRVTGEGDLDVANGWMDWSTPEGLETPSPVEFIGGLNDLPQGTHGYFKVDLTPGDYAFIGEQPDPAAHGFVLPIHVSE
ncbi:MAG: hypothetical protein EP347_10270 [Alphaproteobacteria bacterium]|nr:MAG: hypothetical protein EP347_10270 [Alphaproteobacteria bacterium]